MTALHHQKIERGKTMSELAETIQLLRMWEEECDSDANGMAQMADNRIFCLKIKVRELFSSERKS
jgi:hypothetical protein